MLQEKCVWDCRPAMEWCGVNDSAAGAGSALRTLDNVFLLVPKAEMMLTHEVGDGWDGAVRYRLIWLIVDHGVWPRRLSEPVVGYNPE